MAKPVPVGTECKTGDEKRSTIVHNEERAWYDYADYPIRIFSLQHVVHLEKMRHLYPTEFPSFRASHSKLSNPELVVAFDRFIQESKQQNSLFQTRLKKGDKRPVSPHFDGLPRPRKSFVLQYDMNLLQLEFGISRFQAMLWLQIKDNVDKAVDASSWERTDNRYDVTKLFGFLQSTNDVDQLVHYWEDCDRKLAARIRHELALYEMIHSSSNAKPFEPLKYRISFDIETCSGHVIKSMPPPLRDQSDLHK